jgi:hypothetical protein
VTILQVCSQMSQPSPSLQVLWPSTTRRPTSVCPQNWDSLVSQQYQHMCHRALQLHYLRLLYRQLRDKTMNKSSVINSIFPYLKMESLCNKRAKRDRKILHRNMIRLSIKFLKTSSLQRIPIHKTSSQRIHHQTSSIKLRLYKRMINLTRKI